MKEVEQVQLSFVNFVLHIPAGRNPYLVVREHISMILKPIGAPQWEHVTSKLTLISLIIVSVQACCILHAMVVTRRFTLGNRTSLGMWKFDTITSHSFTSLLFATLSIVDWSLEQSLRSGHRITSPSTQKFVSGLKFLFVFAGIWCFVWATVCHCASVFWSRRTHSSHIFNASVQPTLPAYLRWLSHTLFILPLLILAGVVIWACRGYRGTQLQIEKVIHQLGNELLEASTTYDPKTYSPSSIFHVMFPGSRLIIRNGIEAVKYLDAGIRAFLGGSIFLITVYLPLLFISWKDLRSKTKVLAVEIQNGSNEDRVQLTALKEVMQDTKTTLLYRSLAIFLGITSCTPGLCWDLSHSHQALLRDDNFWAVSGLLSHAPVSICMNIHLCIVNLYCRKVMKAHNQTKANSCAMGPVTIVELSRTSGDLTPPEKPTQQQSQFQSHPHVLLE